MKKIMVLLLVTIFLLVGCSSSDSKNDSNKGKEDDPITVWAWDPNYNLAALNIAKDYYKKVDADLDVTIIENGKDDIVQKLNTALSSGITKGLPNIALIEDYQAQSFLQSFPDAFYPLTDVFNVSDFAEYKIAPTSFNGQNYGLPFDTGVTGLYVRTDYLEEAGYTIDDMKGIDWSEYIEIGKKVKEVTGKDFITIDPNDLRIIQIMIQSAGSWYLKDDGVTPDLAGNEKMKEAFELYKAMLDANIVKINSDWGQFIGIINSGDTVTVPTGNWITPSIKAEESQSGKWAIVPLPTLTVAGATNASNVGGSSWYVLDIPGAEKAADFLGKTFGSDAEFYQQLVTEIGAIGTYKPASEGDAYEIEDEFFQGQKIYADFAEWMEQVPGVNYGLHTYAIDDIITVEMQNYMNGKDIDDVLNDAQKQAESQLK
ncbi:ABC transporter substrate-binding protein [Sporosarcina sp. NPDC096371]|uniref:ABC transporter substrate-binding protein n=1 Tax=Sporosarcina sp. NPDC096371 TaxID=3364530 RepID=UPI0038210F94